MQGADRKKLSELIDSNFLNQVGHGIGTICRSIIDELASLNLGAGRYDFKVKNSFTYRDISRNLSEFYSSLHFFQHFGVSEFYRSFIGVSGAPIELASGRKFTFFTSKQRPA
jgi:hypothetical protein